MQIHKKNKIKKNTNIYFCNNICGTTDSYPAKYKWAECRLWIREKRNSYVDGGQTFVLITGLTNVQTGMTDILRVTVQSCNISGWLHPFLSHRDCANKTWNVCIERVFEIFATSSEHTENCTINERRCYTRKKVC